MDDKGGSCEREVCCWLDCEYAAAAAATVVDSETEEEEEEGVCWGSCRRLLLLCYGPLRLLNGRVRRAMSGGESMFVQRGRSVDCLIGCLMRCGSDDLFVPARSSSLFCKKCATLYLRTPPPKTGRPQ